MDKQKSKTPREKRQIFRLLLLKLRDQDIQDVEARWAGSKKPEPDLPENTVRMSLYITSEVMVSPDDNMYEDLCLIMPNQNEKTVLTWGSTSLMIKAMT